jgi:hypothetical protein
MFMRYTYFGVGHPAILRRIIRDCFDDSVMRGDTTGIINNNHEEDMAYEDNSGNSDYDSGCDDEDEEARGEEFSDEEVELEDEEDEIEDGSDVVDGDEDDDDNFLSF